MPNFNLLPPSFMGALIEKFMGGALAGKGWPCGQIKVAELCGEYSFLGLEAVTRCCKYRAYLTNPWMSEHIATELYAGEWTCPVDMPRCHQWKLCKCLTFEINRAGKTAAGSQIGALGTPSCVYTPRSSKACKCTSL